MQAVHVEDGVLAGALDRAKSALAGDTRTMTWSELVRGSKAGVLAQLARGSVIRHVREGGQAQMFTLSAEQMQALTDLVEAVEQSVNVGRDTALAALAEDFDARMQRMQGQGSQASDALFQSGEALADKLPAGAHRSALIIVLAGVNGAGKSSIGGAALRARGLDYINPDEHARALRQRRPELSLAECNSRVWAEGRDRLADAIDRDQDYFFETTLGGSTIFRLLMDAVERGRQVQAWYCGLDSAELHIEPVAARVARGGHNIPEERIRAHYQQSRLNACALLPGCAHAAVYDNSVPLNNGRPSPQRLIETDRGRLVHPPGPDTPQWAKPIAAAMLKLSTGSAVPIEPAPSSHGYP